LWSGPNRRVGIEVKASTRWRSEFAGPLQEMIDQKVIQHAVVVYLGDRALQVGNVRVLPAASWAASLGDYLR
jgi:hypothetical protein